MKVKLNIEIRPNQFNNDEAIPRGTILKVHKGMETDSRDVYNIPEGMCYLCEYKDKLIYIPARYSTIVEAVDWEQRRYEIAKDAMCALICVPTIPGVDPNPSIESISTHACALADALVQKLKEEQP